MGILIYTGNSQDINEGRLLFRVTQVLLQKPEAAGVHHLHHLLLHSVKPIYNWLMIADQRKIISSLGHFSVAFLPSTTSLEPGPRSHLN